MSSKSFDITEILTILPHRFPFLLVDKILDINLEEGKIIGQKNLTYNESFFQGHFPSVPIMPGVLILEALAQTGAVLVHLKSNQEKIALLLSVNHAKFRNPAKPGDILMLHGEGIHLSSKGGRIKAVATVNDKVAAEAEMGFVLVDQNQIYM